MERIHFIKKWYMHDYWLNCYGHNVASYGFKCNSILIDVKFLCKLYRYVANVACSQILIHRSFVG